jgi:phage baseplate assembly protein W
MESPVLGRGFAFPLRLREGRLRMLGGDAKVYQSLWLILATAPGERPMLPRFGCGIHELVFEANTAALRGTVRERVREAIVRFEPRVDLLEVKVESPLDRRNILEIAISYRVRANNSVYNLVYPFYLQEGVAATPGRLVTGRPN